MLPYAARPPLPAMAMAVVSGTLRDRPVSAWMLAKTAAPAALAGMAKRT
jgi:hypothetical protein